MRTYPVIYNQQDPQWGSKQIGSVSGANIATVGCYLTDYAMTACYYGHQVRPDELNDIFNRQNIYVQGDLLTDDALTKVFPDITYQQTYDFAAVPANLGLLQQLAADEATTVILELDFDHNPNDGIQTHFVCLHDYDGKTLTIFDPWWGTDSDFSLHYGTDPKTTILKFVVYHGNPVGQAVSVPSADFTRLVYNSTQYDSVTGYFNLPKQPDGKDADFGEVKKLLDSDHQTITDLQTEVVQTKNTAAALATEIQKINETDSAAIQTGLTAQHDRDALQATLSLICQALSLPTTASGKEITDAIAMIKSQAGKPVPTPGRPKAIKTFADWIALGFALLKAKFGGGK